MYFLHEEEENPVVGSYIRQIYIFNFLMKGKTKSVFELENWVLHGNETTISWFYKCC